MSKYSRYTTKFKDRDCLVAALKEMDPRWVTGLVVHEQAVQLEGFHGDKRRETAEVVIPRACIGAAANDIGFKLQEDGSYTAIISQYDRGHYNTTWMNQLGVKYAQHGVEKLAAKHKWKLEATPKADGGLLYVGRPQASRF